MVSNQVLQNAIEGVKSISGYEIGLAAPGEEGTLFTAPVFRDAWSYLETFRALGQTEAQKVHPGGEGHRRKRDPGGPHGGVPDPDASGYRPGEL